ncbi:MAG: hypothetical protein HYT72_01145 [Candidatus Aenigmarchaeota archaeon]|nr:hypothetical protein [Candidatus Aenigmarchaeota archaeon]
MDRKGKSAIIFGLIVALGLVAFTTVAIAHINPQGKQTHPVGLDTESCQDAYAGAEEQLADRGTINPRLLANIEDKCGFEFDENCSIEFDAAHEPVLVCGEECVEVSPRDVSFGSCTDISFIEETNLPQCCGFEGPQGGISCGADQEWVVGVAAFPTCYISNS